MQMMKPYFQMKSRSLKLTALMITLLLTSCSHTLDPLYPEMDFSDQCVLLVHGLGRSAYAMKPLQRSLEKQGFQVVNQTYPSTDFDFYTLLENAYQKMMLTCQKKSEIVHVVTHSLGGILTRAYLQEHELHPNSKVVMIAPPNQGSEVTDAYKDHIWYQWFTGPTGQQLGTDIDSIPQQLPPVNAVIGVIAGNQSYEFWFNSVFGGEHDGKVSVERAQLTEMQDFIVVPYNHTTIASQTLVQEQVIHFLVFGQFF